jgi:hypothetical protein
LADIKPHFQWAECFYISLSSQYISFCCGCHRKGHRTQVFWS